MKANNKERSKSKTKMQPQKINNENVKNSNPFISIKYFCFNEVKKIVNNKNKKLSDDNKNNEKTKNQNKGQKIRKEEEDEYTKIIYNKRLIISHNLSFSNLLSLNYSLNRIEENDEYLNYWKSTDERYKALIKYGLNTKKIIRAYKEKSINIRINDIKRSKFSKKERFKKSNKSQNKIKIINNKNFIDIHNINNINGNNIIYRGNNPNINESCNNTLTSNTITSKTITNNTMSIYTISNLSHNSYYNKQKNTNTNSNANHNLSLNKENNEKENFNKINNIKVIINKGRNKNKNMNKNLRNKNMKYNAKENTVFVNRFILEEKFTIDSKGDKHTIYIKKITPAIKTNDIIYSADKRIVKNKKIIKNNDYNNKDNTFINHNDINLNFNVCSFQKINLNNNINKKNSLKEKTENLDDHYFKNEIKNDTIINEDILQNYKDFLNTKNYNKIIYQKPNGIYHSEKNHKSFQSLFSSPNKKYFMKVTGNDLDKNKLKMNKKVVYNSNKNNEIGFKKKRKKESKSINTTFKYMFSQPRCLKNKVVHRKTKTNLNKIEFEKLMDCQEEDEEIPMNKRSLSFVGKNNVYNLVKKLKDNKKAELKDRLKNGNNTPCSRLSSKNPTKINEYFHFSPLNSGINSKSNTKKNSIKKCKYKKKINFKNKSNLYLNMNESNENNSRSHSLNKITSKNNSNSNEMKLFLNYLKNNMALNSGRNKSHRNFLIKRCGKNNLDNILNKSNNNKNGNYLNLIYMKYKAKEKSFKK